nr:hypothetical protein [Acidiferrobacterales bacterium]
WVNGAIADFAFSATRLCANCCDSVFTHEIGHNLGSGHEYSSVNPNPPFPFDECDTRITVTEYACGYGNNSSGWGTIMSNFSNKAAIGYLFSNTDNSCQGSACGIAAGNFEAADNRTSFNLSRLVVAEFRDEVITQPPNNPGNTDYGWLPGVLFNLIEDEEN